MASQGLKLKTYSILDDYAVTWSQKLGCGISGPVRPCKSKKTGECFALKCLLDKPRARQEVNLHLKCTGHPHIVHIYDVYANEVQFPGESQPMSRLLLVMELMDGGELFDRISKQKYFTESQAARYTKQISLAIHRCHNLGIAHRDIKPENLLLKDNQEEAQIKLSDFGFAKIDEGDLTTPHFTPYYVAPQVLEAQKRQAKERYCILPQGSPYTYDKSCDMWSLGVIIYIMLCGYPPFYSETPSKQITRNMKKKIMAGQYEFPDEDWQHISHLAKDLVKRLLKVSPAERMTVEQILQHPWLHEAPDTQLQSPSVLLDQNALFDVKQEHSHQLTNLRLPDTQVMLKPLTDTNNPILKKRHASANSTAHSNSQESSPVKQTGNNLGLQKLRDVIAHCILPSKDTSETTSLSDLVQAACPYYRENHTFQQILQKWHWDGSQFPEDTDENLLAASFSEFVTSLSKS